MELVEQYWPLVLGMLPVLAKYLNRKTPHWSSAANKIHAVALLLVEALDVLRKPAEYKDSMKKKEEENGGE